MAEERFKGFPGGLEGFLTDLSTHKRKGVVRRSPDRVRDVLFGARAASGPYEVWGSTYKRVPGGFDPAHENAEFLLHSGLSAGVSTPWPPEIHSAAFLDYCFEHLGNLGPSDVLAGRVAGGVSSDPSGYA